MSTTATITLDRQDKLQLGMDRLFGACTVEAEDRHREIPAFRGLRHAFKVITGRELADVQGHLVTTAQEEILSMTWTNILGASMHRRLIKDYVAPAYGENNIISYRPGGVSNFKTQETLRVNYLADLSPVDPETADYVEIVEPGDEAVTWDVLQKGNLLTVSRKTMLNDDLGAVIKTVGRVGRAARRTFAKFVWGFWVNNSLYEADGTAWFTTGGGSHLNLVATTLTADTDGAAHILDALILLGGMIEPGSGERLGLPELRNLMCWLVVPIELMAIAHILNSSPTILTALGAPAGNPVYHLFGANDERIIVNALLTDATDWGIFRDPSEVDSIEIGFLNDQREPEFFVASVPTIGQMFIADKQQYKVRHEYGGNIVDFRGAVKSEQ